MGAIVLFITAIVVLVPDDTTDGSVSTDSTSVLSPDSLATDTMPVVAAAPATGTWYVTDMKSTAEGYSFDRADGTLIVGDGLEWKVVSGGPHQVQFVLDSLPEAARAQLVANMSGNAEAMGPMLTKPGETFSLSFAGLPPGEYPYHCVMHRAAGMTGTITLTERSKAGS